jgi:hypothetical protein
MPTNNRPTGEFSLFSNEITRTRAGRSAWSPEQEVAALALLRQALEKGALETPTIEEPMLLLARLEADPQEAMRLLTESAPGETFEIDLDPDPDQAAAQLLEEIVASLRAQTATPPL